MDDDRSPVAISLDLDFVNRFLKRLQLLDRRR